MLEVFMYVVILALVILVVFYFYVEAQRKKAIIANKKAISLRVTRMKSNFKADLKKLVEQEVVTISEHNSLYQIANNFFVFQKITPNSISYCEQQLKSVISAMLIKEVNNNYELIQEQVSLFVSSLPKVASGYNTGFYQTELPALINQLIDAQEGLNIIEEEGLNIIKEEEIESDDSQFDSPMTTA